MRQLRDTGNLLAKPCDGGESTLNLHAEKILAVLREKPDAILGEMIAVLAERHNIQTSQSALCRFFKRHKIIRRKKTMYPSKQKRPGTI